MRACGVGALALVLLALGATQAEARVNPDVAGLQVALSARGVYAGAVDGVAGPLTVRGVRTFQKHAGLRVDGIAGRQTRKALGRLGRPLFGRRLIRRGAVGWDVSVLQFLLAQRGFAPAVVDGRFGPQTGRALRRFQRMRGLVVDAIVGPATSGALIGRIRTPEAPPAPPPSEIPGLVDRWAARYAIDPKLARALAWQESGFQADLTSAAGAWGVMQVTPETWEFVETVVLGGVRVPRTVDGGIRVGVAYLGHLLRLFDGNERRALGAYFQGPHAVRKHGLFRETKPFVRNVLALKGRV